MKETTERIASSASFTDTKPHYEILDGLRGAAALMVVWYHVFEGFAFAQGTGIETFNHGHLGVDFFFMLSGFVISYAYDDRWQAPAGKRLTLGNFFKRRLIRLHPMIIIGALIGMTTFLIQGGVRWDGTETPILWVMVALLMSMLLLPAYPGAGYDVRGNGEMYSLNGPSWSLFFEYLGNIMYALFIRRLPNKALACLVAISGVLWAWFAIGNVSGYDMLGVGWTLEGNNFLGGLLRMTFPFTLGMLIARNFKPVRVPGIFWISIAVLFALFSVPYIPADLCSCAEGISLNSTYELACIVLVFPLIVWLAASGNMTGQVSHKVCKFLGDLSYPLYIVHYPVMYLFYSWLIKNKFYTLAETWQVVILVFAINITLAYACLKLWDEPVRRWLTKRFIK
ncbi:MAG: acyltransferase [Bacteroidaceae bacterium]|nr:acyltransferase [Bacteroidaceae bacterium]